MARPFSPFSRSAVLILAGLLLGAGPAAAAPQASLTFTGAPGEGFAVYAAPDRGGPLVPLATGRFAPDGAASVPLPDLEALRHETTALFLVAPGAAGPRIEEGSLEVESLFAAEFDKVAYKQQRMLPNGNIVTYCYNSHGKLLKKTVTDPQGNVLVEIEYTYDKGILVGYVVKEYRKGKLHKEVEYELQKDGTYKPVSIKIYHYNPGGSLKKVVIYNGKGQPISVIIYENGRPVQEYPIDENGKPITGPIFATLPHLGGGPTPAAGGPGSATGQAGTGLLQPPVTYL